MNKVLVVDKVNLTIAIFQFITFVIAIIFRESIGDFSSGIVIGLSISNIGYQLLAAFRYQGGRENA